MMRMMSKWNWLAISGLFGAGLTWLGMLETGLADRWDAGAVVLDVVTLAGSVAVLCLRAGL